MLPIFKNHFSTLVRITFAVAVICLSVLSLSAQTIDCGKVKDQLPTFIRKGAITMELDDSTRLDMKIFATCGEWDKLDSVIFKWPNIINVVMDYGDIVEDETYGQILDVVKRYQSTETYIRARTAIMAETAASSETENREPMELSGETVKLTIEPAQEYGTFYQFADVASAVEAGKFQNKPVLVYFTCWTCVNARKLEDYVMVNKEIQAILNENYLCFSAYVDDKSSMHGLNVSVGKKNTGIQIEHFKSNDQPHFYILDETGKAIADLQYTLSVDDFKAFLQKGLSGK